MSVNVETRRESARGCGYRQAGGIYLVTDGQGRGCGRIPFPLEVCPTCNQGIKPARAWTWVESAPIIAAMDPCSWGDGFSAVAAIGDPINFKKRQDECEVCPMRTELGRVGLLWIGEKYYSTPEDFLKEAQKMGISRRIPAVPVDFKLGETWVWLAHRKAISAEHEDGCHTANNPAWECDCGATDTPGIFYSFKPERVEYVVKEDDDEVKLARMADRDITLIKIEKIGEQEKLLH